MNYLDNLFIIESIDDSENGFSARLHCNPSHPVYQAHFPGSPITPGACLLQMASVVLKQKLGRPVYLMSSKNVKFLNVLVPAEGKEVCYNFSNITQIENGCKAQLVIADDITVYSKMSLTFCYELV